MILPFLFIHIDQIIKSCVDVVEKCQNAYISVNTLSPFLPLNKPIILVTLCGGKEAQKKKLLNFVRFKQKCFFSLLNIG